jgi:dTDP-4-amino-4,6-dideoxygalactose transaminase
VVVICKELATVGIPERGSLASWPDEPIPNVRLDDAALFDALLPRLRDLVSRGAFTLGPEVEEFEAAAAAAFGCRWAVGTSSGTSALVLALRAAPLALNSRVAIPANTFFATAEAVVAAGHVPVIVDHDEDHLIDLDQLQTLDLDAVVPVHLHGLPVDMERLSSIAERRGWWVLEDAAQAHGATVSGQAVGSLGDAAAFSAYPTKNLVAWGDAGFVTGHSEELEVRIRMLRHHGQTAANHHEMLGGTERLDNLQALVLLAKLPLLPEEIGRRRRVADWYAEELGQVGLVLPGDRDGRVHVFHHYVISLPAHARDACLQWLARHGIGAAVHYPTPVHLQPALQGRFQIGGQLERGERSGSEVLSLPMHGSLTRSQVARVGEVLRAFVAKLDPKQDRTA